MIFGLPNVRLERPRGEKPVYRHGRGPCFCMWGDLEGSYYGHGATEDEAHERLTELLAAMRRDGGRVGT